MSIPIALTGNLTDDPELRFTPAGAAVAKFTVAVNPRIYDKATNEWRDGEPSFYRCDAWRQLAENIAESLHKGDRVVVRGSLAERHWTDEKTQEKRSGWQVTAESVGPDLTYATAAVRKLTRTDRESDPGDPWRSASRERPAEATR